MESATAAVAAAFETMIKIHRAQRRRRRRTMMAVMRLSLASFGSTKARVTRGTDASTRTRRIARGSSRYETTRRIQSFIRCLTQGTTELRYCSSQRDFAVTVVEKEERNGRKHEGNAAVFTSPACVDVTWVWCACTEWNRSSLARVDRRAQTTATASVPG